MIDNLFIYFQFYYISRDIYFIERDKDINYIILITMRLINKYYSQSISKIYYIMIIVYTF